jgi:hypothetical protein
MKKSLCIVTGYTSVIVKNIINNLQYEHVIYLGRTEINEKGCEFIPCDFSNLNDVLVKCTYIFDNYKGYNLKYLIIGQGVGINNVKYRDLININFTSIVLLTSKLKPLFNYGTKILVLSSTSIHRLFVTKEKIKNVFLKNMEGEVSDEDYALSKICLDVYYKKLIHSIGCKIYLMCPGYNKTKLSVDNLSNTNELIKFFSQKLMMDPETSGNIIGKFIENDNISGFYNLKLILMLPRNLENEFNLLTQNKIEYSKWISVVHEFIKKYSVRN